MADIEVFAPKLTFEQLVNNWEFTEKDIKMLIHAYQNEWKIYQNTINYFLEEKPKEIEYMELYVDSIKPITKNEFETIEETKARLFSNEKLVTFVQWLLKSRVLTVNDDQRVIGNAFTHKLPISFKIYLNKQKVESLKNLQADEQFKIQQFEKNVDFIKKTIEEKSNIKLYRTDAVTTEHKFEYFTVIPEMTTNYNKSEDTFIKHFIEAVNQKFNEPRTSMKSLGFNNFNKNNQSQELVGTVIVGLLASPFILIALSLFISIIFLKVTDHKNQKRFDKIKKHMMTVIKTKLPEIYSYLNKDWSLYQQNYKVYCKFAENLNKNNPRFKNNISNEEEMKKELFEKMYIYKLCIWFNSKLPKKQQVNLNECFSLKKPHVITSSENISSLVSNINGFTKETSDKINHIFDSDNTNADNSDYWEKLLDEAEKDQFEAKKLLTKEFMKLKLQNASISMELGNIDQDDFGGGGVFVFINQQMSINKEIFSKFIKECLNEAKKIESAEKYDLIFGYF